MRAAHGSREWSSVTVTRRRTTPPGRRLVSSAFFDWDNAGPTTRQDDVAWVGFAWTPLHARSVVETEGFTAFEQRRDRLEIFLAAYGWNGTTDGVLALVDARLSKQVEVMRVTAAAGDPAYQAMLLRGQDKLLDAARQDLAEV